MITADLAAGVTKFIYLGAEKEVKKTASVEDTLTALLTADHLTQAIILVDGDEATTPSELPPTFDGHIIEVKRYEKAG